MPSPAEPLALKARWVFPGDAAPLPGGVVWIQGDRIVGVEPAGTRVADLDLGNVAILPGFVNAHTHLDLSDARGDVPPSPDFVGWLRRVIEHRRGQTPADVDTAIRQGLGESCRFGTTLLGDISSGGGSWAYVLDAPARATVFYELLGLTMDRARQAWDSAKAWSAGRAEFQRGVTRRSAQTCRAGFSPHAPYSFNHDMLSEIPRVEPMAPLAVHLAESAAEVQLIDCRSGPFIPFLVERGVWDPAALPWSFESVIESTKAARTVLYVHGNYLDPETAIPPNGTIVYCPRTHAAFGHPPHPFREFLKRGVRVALGTDSLASNPDLDILAEARFIATRHPDLPGETLLRMLTLSGAEALRWADVTGSLTPGKSADLVVLPLPDRDAADPHRLVFDSALPVERVMFRGQWR